MENPLIGRPGGGGRCAMGMTMATSSPAAALTRAATAAASVDLPAPGPPAIGTIGPAHQQGSRPEGGMNGCS